MSIQQRAVEFAIARLQAAGASFHIRDADGVEYGEPIPKKRTRIAQVNGPSLLHLYQDKIGAMVNMGDVCAIDIPEGVDARRLKHNAESYARNRYGHGSVMGCIENNQVQLMRLK
ncbi:hypothetical protein [Paraburkholderia sp. BL10I2N1]|uniref:hypothetical protein n=1 Tax=Paraburkholderia sp. BL10I2N1 TaxID=1938796 RepID=UPI001061311E|nr:hypothetical protein [Paraburkholderia sp. BL10I2N1]TDN70470.1 hypothetical protein B0G77_3944 [Paraburkholderia sp. BL10I2N1]